MAQDVLTLLLVGCSVLEPPPPPPPPVQPVAAATRWVENAGGIVLQVASDRYEHEDGRVVEVYGAVHVADPVFYEVTLARLKGHRAVRYEGLVDDEGGPSTSEPQRVAEAYGLMAQSDVSMQHDGWSRTDLTVSELRGRMVGAEVAASTVRDLLGHPDDPPPPPLDVPEHPTGRALAKLALVKQLAREPSDDPAFQRWILDERNEHVVEQVLGEGLSDVGLWYGADHLPGLGRRLQEHGFGAPQRSWTPAILVGYAELQLGPTQAKMLLR
jgi:hypothetical protein